MGGEKAATFLAVCGPKGSPPRGRGKVHVDFFGFLCRGITPAWAGKSAASKLFCQIIKDHPRVGGEKSFQTACRVRCLGSPPRGRGKEVADEGIGGIIRITPAWAGKSRVRPYLPPSARDHPRIGGEKTQNPQAVNALWGSPPRGRGKVHDAHEVWGLVGITPAMQGNASHCIRRVLPVGLSLQSGDKTRTVFRASSCIGLPPQMQGKNASQLNPRP